MLRITLVLLRPSSLDILYKNNLDQLFTLSVKVTEPDLCKGENHVLKKPETLAHKFKSGKRKISTNFNSYFNCKWLAVVIPTINTYYKSYIKYTITIFKRRNHSTIKKCSEYLIPPKTETVKHSGNLSHFHFQFLVTLGNQEQPRIIQIGE